MRGQKQKDKLARRLNRFAEQVAKQEKAAAAKRGIGEYVYQNRTQATLFLPKPSMEGLKAVAPNGKWRGDNYFMFMVPREAVIVEVISDGTTKPEEQPQPQAQPQQETQEKQMNEKLILDQPEKVTSEGTVEHVAVPKMTPAKPLNEANPSPKAVSREVLLNDDAGSGIDIING